MDTDTQIKEGDILVLKTDLNTSCAFCSYLNWPDETDPEGKPNPKDVYFRATEDSTHSATVSCHLTYDDAVRDQNAIAGPGLTQCMGLDNFEYALESYGETITPSDTDKPPAQTFVAGNVVVLCSTDNKQSAFFGLLKWPNDYDGIEYSEADPLDADKAFFRVLSDNEGDDWVTVYAFRTYEQAFTGGPEDCIGGEGYTNIIARDELKLWEADPAPEPEPEPEPRPEPVEEPDEDTPYQDVPDPDDARRALADRIVETAATLDKLLDEAHKERIDVQINHTRSPYGPYYNDVPLAGLEVEEVDYMPPRVSLK